MPADPRPRPRLGGRRACLVAGPDWLVLADGTALWHRPDPLGPAAEDAGWLPLTVPDSAVVALATGPDLDHRRAQLFAVTEDQRLLAWTLRTDRSGPADADEHDDGPASWVAWPPETLDRPVRALARWTARPGDQQLVAAGADGVLLERRQHDWATGTRWEPVGMAPDAIALDAVAGADGCTELYLLTAEGELKVKRQQRDADGTLRWGGVETVDGWAEPAVALTSWTLDDGIQHQAVLLRTGRVHQRWRSRPEDGWSAWWQAPALADDVLTATPAALAGATEPANGNGRHGRQYLATLVGRDTVLVRRWTPEDGWLDWERPLPAPDHARLPETVPEPSPAPRPTPEPVAAGPGEPPRAPAGWWEEPAADAAGGTETVTTALAPDPASAVTTALGPREGHPTAGPTADPTADPTGAPAADRDVTSRASVRAESATVLFTGRELQPLRPGDPARIGPFKLTRRVAGGQGGTDKFVARDGRGWCFLKVLRDDAGDEEVTAFRRESTIAQRVTNRHRLTTYVDHRDRDDTLDPDEPAFLALSFVPGRDLDEVVARRPLERDDLLRLAHSLLEALGELRDAGLVHGDLKPANVIMRDDHYPVLVDFGSAVPADTTVITEAAFGTPGYAPPELERRVVGPATDVYGWGAVLIKAGTGRRPADDLAERTAQIEQLPAELRSPVAAALSDEPANRPELDQLRRELSHSVPSSDEGLIRDRLPLDSAAQQRIPALLAPATPQGLAARAAALTLTHYRRALGVAALAGIVVGVVLGTFLITWLRSL